MAGGMYGLAISHQSVESRFWLLIYAFEQNVKISGGFACQVMTTFETALPRQTLLINLAHQASLSSNCCENGELGLLRVSLRLHCGLRRS